MAQLGKKKMLVGQAGGAELEYRKPCEKAGHCDVCSQSQCWGGRDKRKDPWYLLFTIYYPWHGLFGEFQAWERPVLQQTRWMVPEKDTWGSPLTYTQTHAHTTHTYTHIKYSLKKCWLGKGTCCQAWWPRFCLWDPGGRKREQSKHVVFRPPHLSTQGHSK